MDLLEQLQYHRDQLALLESYGNAGGQRGDQARQIIAAAETKLAALTVVADRAPAERPAARRRATRDEQED